MLSGLENDVVYIVFDNYVFSVWVECWYVEGVVEIV